MLRLVFVYRIKHNITRVQRTVGKENLSSFSTLYSNFSTSKLILMTNFQHLQYRCIHRYFILRAYVFIVYWTYLRCHIFNRYHRQKNKYFFILSLQYLLFRQFKKMYCVGEICLSVDLSTVDLVVHVLINCH